MRALLQVSTAIDRFCTLIGKAVTFLILIAVLVSAGNAASRKLLDLSSNAWLELQWYMFGAVVLLGAAYTLQRNEHVRVDILYSWVAPKTRLWIDLLGFVFFFLPVMTFLLFVTWPFFVRSFQSGEMSNNAGGLIIWPAKLLLPLGFALLMLQGASELIKRIAALRGSAELETAYQKPVQ